MVEDNAKALAAETELKKYGVFAEDYVNTLDELCSSKPKDKNGFTIGEWCSWECDQNIVKTRIDQHEYSVSLGSLCGIGNENGRVPVDNRILSKVLLALSSIAKEIDELANEAKNEFYNPLLFYGEGLDSDANDEGAFANAISRLLPTLQHVTGFSDHSSEVILNALSQLASLYSKEKKVLDVSDIHQTVFMDSLCKLFVTLITLDSIVINQGSLSDHWSTYKRVINAAEMDPSKYNSSKEKISLLRKLLAPTDNKVLNGHIFRSAVSQSFDKNGVKITDHTSLGDEFLHYLKAKLVEIEAATSKGTPRSEDMIKFVGFCGFYVLHNNLYFHTDKKLVSRILEVCKKVPSICLSGNVMWFPEQFLLEHLPVLSQNVDKKVWATFSPNRQTYLQQKSSSASNDIKQYHLQLNTWMMHLEEAFTRGVSNLSLDHLQKVSDLLLQGVDIADTIRNNVSTILNLHGKLSKPLTKTTVIALCKMVEILKAIEHTFNRHSLAIVGIVPHMSQHISYSIMASLRKSKRTVMSEKNNKQMKMDALQALLVAENAISGPITSSRTLVTLISFQFCHPRLFKQDEAATIYSNMNRLSMLSNIRSLMEQACDTGFLYWHRVILSPYFGYIYDQKTDPYRLHYTFYALKDVVACLTDLKHLTDPTALKTQFEDEIWKYTNDKILNPLCHDLETDLRLHVHSHLKLDDQNPFKAGLKNLSCFLQVQPIPFGDKYINIKAHVEAYLERIFYNLTTVALHNWRTYGEMRGLALQKFDAKTVDDHLPAQTLEQGLDVIEIMRNINVFVSRFLYNLNNQVFVEHKSSSKHLNTINIRHVANSIRTHGTGIMNTAVNSTYQFLRKKFSIFSQFLYDEQIKSRLTKDLRFFRQNLSALDHKYPFERANKFHTGIRKLGLMPDGGTYLDQFRILVTHIGNAMGYVRMIRSGGLHFVSNSIRFIPNIENEAPNFEELATLESMAKESIESGKTFDQVLENLVKNFSDGNNYFQLLVNVFGKQLNDTRQSHLKKFYIIVPPLTINYVEHIIAGKEKMNKKNKDDAFFTDDGLAMGIAYILQVLDQWSLFDSLHWFTAVKDLYEKQIQGVQKQKDQTNDEKLTQTLALELKRLDSYLKEFQLLYYGLSSARIFFRPTEDIEDEEEEDGSDATNRKENDDEAELDDN